MKRLVRGGRIVDPASGRDEIGDVLVDASGRLAAVGGRIEAPDALRIEAEGKLVLPGLVDLHVHLREPGQEYKETIETGARAAAAGGFTAVAAMANTDPVNDCAAVTAFVRRRAAEVAPVRVYPIAAVTVGLEGERLTEIGELVEAGAVALSDDGRPVADARLLRRALEYASMFGVPIVEHCETPSLHPGGVAHEGVWSTVLGLHGIPSASEEIAVRRDIALAAMTGGRLHVAHVSTRGAVEAIREAKERGVAVTCEVTPHHLLLTDEAIRDYDPNTKMNPPLRSEEDREALVEALADGTIDAVATDHAPHHPDEKCATFDDAPFGVVGLETALPVLLDRLVGGGRLSLSRLVEALALAPARILGLELGRLEPGRPADLVVVDPSARWVVDPDRFLSKARNTCFAGWEVRGRVELTLVEGRVAFEAREAEGP